MSSGYRIEFRDERGRWQKPYGLGTLQRGWADGYLQRCREMPGPRLAARLVRESDGKVMGEVPSIEDAGLGMIAGFPTWQQYTRAALGALDKAAAVLKREGRGVGSLLQLREELQEWLSDGDVP